MFILDDINSTNVHSLYDTLLSVDGDDYILVQADGNQYQIENVDKLLELCYNQGYIQAYDLIWRMHHKSNDSLCFNTHIVDYSEEDANWIDDIEDLVDTDEVCDRDQIANIIESYRRK